MALYQDYTDVTGISETHTKTTLSLFSKQLLAHHPLIHPTHICHPFTHIFLGHPLSHTICFHALISNHFKHFIGERFIVFRFPLHG